MKKILFSFFSLALPVIGANAQAPFTTRQYIDINNIKASSLVQGDMWWDPVTSIGDCKYINGSVTKLISNASALWLSGYDAQGQLHVSAQTYRQTGNDFWPGPIDQTGTGSTLYAHEAAWSKIWKLNKTTVDSFRLLTQHTVANTNNTILTWPAKGNAYAAGANNTSLTISPDLAPFVDVNGDGIYNPLAGDYPQIKGDQTLWWLTNDAGVTHNVSQPAASSFYVEIQNMAYAYKTTPTLSNIVFYEYKITNKGIQSFNTMRLSQFADMEIGGIQAYNGFDSVHRMGVNYGALSVDSTSPIAGVAFVELPGDNGTNYIPVGSFSSYDNLSSGATRNPVAGADYYNLTHSAYTDGTLFPNGRKYYVGLTTMCDSGITPADRRLVIASSDFSLPVGGTVKVGMALIVAPNSGGCPKMDFTGVLTGADTAWYIYHNPPPALGIANAAAPKHKLKIYPNPAQNTIYLETSDDIGKGNVEIRSIDGKRMPAVMHNAGNKIEISTEAWPSGFYQVMYRNNDLFETATFVISR